MYALPYLCPMSIRAECFNVSESVPAYVAQRLKGVCDLRDCSDDDEFVLSFSLAKGAIAMSGTTTHKCNQEDRNIDGHHDQRNSLP